MSFRLRSTRFAAEAALQKQVAAMLRAYLPKDVWFTASLSGVRLTPAIAGQAKAAGMEKGAPDLSFVFPDGSTRYIELKTEGGALTPEQKRLAGMLGDNFAVCRSTQDVRAELEGWLTPYGLRLLTDTESWKRECAGLVA